MNAASDYIQNDVLGSCISEFKSCINGKPYVRWHNDSFGYGPNGWHRMAVLYCAPCANAARRRSIGFVGKELIRQFRDEENYSNLANGCENASPSSTHFTYVVWR